MLVPMHCEEGTIKLNRSKQVPGKSRRGAGPSAQRGQHDIVHDKKDNNPMAKPAASHCHFGWVGQRHKPRT